MSSRIFQRGIAAATIAAIALAIAPVQAANVSSSIQINDSATFNTASTAVTKIEFTTGANLVAGDTISMTLTGFTTTSFATANVTVEPTNVGNATVTGNVITAPVTGSITAGTNLEFTIDANVTTPAAPATASVAVSTSKDDNGVQLFYFGSNTVSVSATVQPTLTMNLDTPSISFGNLTTTPTARDISIDYSSNAAGGVAIAMASTGLTSATAEIGATDINGARANIAGTKYRVSTNIGADFTGAAGAITSTDGANIAATQTVITSAASPVTVNDTIVRVGAAITADTPAGTYSDTLTFTATGSF